MHKPYNKSSPFKSHHICPLLHLYFAICYLSYTVHYVTPNSMFEISVVSEIFYDPHISVM